MAKSHQYLKCFWTFRKCCTFILGQNITHGHKGATREGDKPLP